MRQRLTPIDVLNIRFNRRVSGYAIPEVDDFVQKVAADLESALSECAVQKEKIAGMEREIAQYRTLETSMRDALTFAQKSAEETKLAAQTYSESLVQDAHRRAAELEVGMDRVRMEHRRLVHEVRAKLRAHLEWLELEAPEQSAIQPVYPTVPLSESITDGDEIVAKVSNG